MAASSKRPPLSHEEVNCIFLNRYCAKFEISEINNYESNQWLSLNSEEELEETK